jgi:hypothetical protein
MPLEKFKAFVSRHYHHLMQIRDTPHAIAGGIAIGVFIGFTPLVGFKTLLAVLIAWLFRCSKLSSALGVAFHDILLPFWPLILRWQYVIGFWVLSHPHQGPPQLPLHHLTFEHWLHLRTLKVIWPMLLGSFFMAAPVALVFYLITLRIVSRYQAKVRREAAESSGI